MRPLVVHSFNIFLPDSSATHSSSASLRLANTVMFHVNKTPRPVWFHHCWELSKTLGCRRAAVSNKGGICCLGVCCPFTSSSPPPQSHRRRQEEPDGPGSLHCYHSNWEFVETGYFRVWMAHHLGPRGMEYWKSNQCQACFSPLWA